MREGPWWRLINSTFEIHQPVCKVLRLLSFEDKFTQICLSLFHYPINYFLYKVIIQSLKWQLTQYWKMEETKFQIEVREVHRPRNKATQSLRNHTVKDKWQTILGHQTKLWCRLKHSPGKRGSAPCSSRVPCLSHRLNLSHIYNLRLFLWRRLSRYQCLNGKWCSWTSQSFWVHQPGRVVTKWSNCGRSTQNRWTTTIRANLGPSLKVKKTMKTHSGKKELNRRL